MLPAADSYADADASQDTLQDADAIDDDDSCQLIRYAAAKTLMPAASCQHGQRRLLRCQLLPLR